MFGIPEALAVACVLVAAAIAITCAWRIAVWTPEEHGTEIALLTLPIATTIEFALASALVGAGRVVQEFSLLTLRGTA